MESNHIPISSSELGNLWMLYQSDTMLLRMLEYFINKAEYDDSKMILDSFYKELSSNVEKLKTIFINEGAVIPVGFTSKDVAIDAPPLFNYYFDIMLLRIFMKVHIGLNALNSSMAYRKDIFEYYKNLTTLSLETYNTCTQFLLEKGILSRPPLVTMPKEPEFVKDINYMSGYNIFTDKRSLNTVEISFVYQGIETNVLGTQLMTGFAQVANEPEVKKYFIRGKELAKKITSTMIELFLENDIQAPSTGAGRATDSKIAPFQISL